VVRYLALGDSYTIGEKVAPEERWPAQLAFLLRARGLAVADPEIVAQTGWTTGELMAGIEKAAPKGPFDLVSLLIGVNDQYRGRDAEEYRARFGALLLRSVSFAGGDAGRVVVVSIPDWGATPFARGCNRAVIAAEIDRFNDVSRERAKSAGARYVDVTGVSGLLGHPGSEALLAPDDLHPSGAMYAEWARRILPQALAALGGGPGAP
jgi:lysophospholipase L1-like esterase